jgi:hypothetical protein
MTMTIKNNNTTKGGNIMLSDGCNSIPQIPIDQLNGYRSLFVGLEKLGLSSDQVAALAYERYSTCARVLSEHLALLEDFAGKQLACDDERAINTFFVKHTKLVLDLLQLWEVPHQIMKIGGCPILALGKKVHPYLLFRLDANQFEDTKKEEVKPMETKVDVVAFCESCGRKSRSKMLREDVDMMDKLGHVLRSENGTIIVLTDGCPDCESF